MRLVDHVVVRAEEHGALNRRQNGLPGGRNGLALGGRRSRMIPGGSFAFGCGRGRMIPGGSFALGCGCSRVILRGSLALGGCRGRVVFAFGSMLGLGMLDACRHAEPAAQLGFVAEEDVVPQHAREHRTKRQNAQRDQHHPGAFMRVIMGMMIAARSAEKGHEHQTPGIEGCHEGRDHQHPEGILAAHEGAFDHGVLRQESGEADMRQRNADAGDRQRADHHRPEGQRDLLAKAPVVPHVLLLVHCMDHRTGAQEQHRLEEGMGEQVEHRHRIDAHPGGHEHVAQLRTGRIGDHALDVVLHQPDRGRKEGCGGANDNDHRLGIGGIFKDRRHAADQEDARRHHGGGMDQRRHRGGAFHRVRQPGVQEQLCRLAHRPDEQQHANQVGRVPLGPQEADVGFRQDRTGGKDIVKAHRIHQEEQREDPQGEAEVAHPVHDEGLHRGGIGAGFPVVEPDQQIRGDPDPFPAEEHLHQVVSRHQHQHGKGEEREVGKEARLVMLAVLPVVVMRHVAKAVEMDERRDGVHHHQHDRRQPVQPDRPFCTQTAGIDPAHQHDLLGFAVKGQEDDPAEQRRQEHQPGGDDLPRLFANQAPAEAADQRADQRREKDDRGHARLAPVSVSVLPGHCIAPRLSG